MRELPESVRAKFDRALLQVIDRSSATAELPVLLILEPVSGDTADLCTSFRVIAAGVLDKLAAAGIHDVRELWISNAVAVGLPVALLISVAALPEVRHVVLDSPRSSEL
ncbi:hypothetical protein CBI38_33740 (plasmid) [Rhodococcus oxybenzonivorans]|uniref:Uncharacterized protein n=1 Tax=Rhodococcus oxybenzonivorans TaxID=1990687 RepID=A0A2S2C661_9NOCA|nr:hypothetical protein [Rhodococcus oxybenzonivorans]AWK76387.1 hypothetical protein CBI38_33740 [Rhodococcus oxybenzonivorans]